MPMSLDRSPDTNVVIEVLRGCNNEISYYELARQSGLSLGRTKAVLFSARRVLRAENGMLFGCIYGQGLKLLSDADKVRKPEAFKRRVMRGAGREIRDLETIAHYDRLSKEEQQSVTINKTVLSVIRAQARVRPEPPKREMAPPPVPVIGNIIRRGER
jgi:hypothetical protein